MFVVKTPFDLTTFTLLQIHISVFNVNATCGVVPYIMSRLLYCRLSVTRHISVSSQGEV